MSHIFYLLMIFPILWESLSLTQASTINRFIKKSITNKSREEMDIEDAALTIFQCLYLLWTFIGLFTFQWPLFILLFIIGEFNSSKRSVWYTRIDAFICLILLFFILVNAYHFHLDIWALMTNIVK